MQTQTSSFLGGQESEVAQPTLHCVLQRERSHSFSKFTSAKEYHEYVLITCLPLRLLPYGFLICDKVSIS